MKSMLRFFLTGLVLAILPFSAFAAPMSGSYTIGGSSPNYSSISAAITALYTDGVNGPVTFHIRPGSYSDQLYISTAISGASASNTITFEGVNWRKTTVSGSYALYLYQTSYIKVKNIKFVSSANYGAYIYQSNYCRVDGCRIVGNLTTTSSSYYGAYIYQCKYDTVKNSRIEGGYYSVYMYGTGTTFGTNENMALLNNIMVNGHTYGIYHYYGLSNSIEGNRIDSLRSTSTNYYINNYYCSNSNYNRNTITYRFGYYFGIYNYYENYYPTSNTYVTNVKNNYIAGTPSNYIYGIYNATNSSRVRIYNNTVIYNSSSTSGYPIYLTSGSNNRVKNNNIYQNSTSGGYAVYISSASYVDSFDYNNIHSNNSSNYVYFAGARANLTALKAYSTAFNQNTIDETISYSSYFDPYEEHPVLNNRGQRGPEVLVDIKNEKRPTSPDKKVDIGCNDYYLPPVDAGIAGFGAGAFCAGSTTPEVYVKNFGTSTLTACTVNWAISTNGGAYSTQTATSFSGSLASGSSSLVSLGSFTMSAGNYYTVKAWTSDPNSTTDGNTNNDEASQRFEPALVGNFTIGNTGADFKTIGLAVSRLAEVGACGPVTFRLLDAKYTEQVVIPQINGTSKTNRVRFVGKGLNNTTIRYSATSTSDWATVLLNGADYITFDSMSIVAKGTTYGIAVLMANLANYNTISNCNLLANTSTTSSNINVAAISTSTSSISSGTNSGNYNTFENCLFRGGYYGYYAYGTSSTVYIYGNNLINCDFYKQYYYGAYTYYGRDRYIVNCNMDSFRNSTYYPLFLAYGIKDSIAGNYINAATTSGSYAVYNYYLNVYGTTTDTTYFVNNTIIGGTSYALYGLLNYRTLFYGNSVLTNNTTYGCLYLSTITGTQVKNNNFYNATGPAVYFSSPTGASSGGIDYNNYYAPNSSSIAYFGAARADLSALQAAYTAYNANSINVDPGYLSATDLHSLSTNTNNMGVNLKRFRKDIDGETRPVSPDVTFDIGSDDYYLAPLDLDVISITPTVASSGKNTVSLTARSNGYNTITSDTAFVSYSIDGGKNWVHDSMVISSLAPGNDMSFNFSTKINVSSGFDLCVRIDRGIKGDPDTDELCQSVCIGAMGKYVIDKNGGGDFSSFSAALASITGCGLAGPVTFTVKNGRYVERLEIPEIKNASATNTITFVGESKEGVNLTNSGTSTTNWQTILFNGADYVTFKDMTIRAKGSSYANNVWFTNGSDYNKIENCRLWCNPNGTSSLNVSIVFSASSTSQSSYGNSGSFNTIEGCLVRGGYYGLYLYGSGNSSASTYNKGLTLKNNDFYRQYLYYAYMMYSREKNIEGNDFDSLRNYTSYAIYHYYAAKDRFVGNRVIGHASNSYPIYAYYHNYTGTLAGDSSIFANNMVTGGSTAALYSVYNYNTHMVYNSFYASNANYVVYHGYCNNSLIRNNAYYQNGTGYTVYYPSTSSIASGAINNNNYYAPNASSQMYYAAVYSNLAAWQSAVSTQNSNSISIDPQFVSTSNLRSGGLNMNNKGIKVWQMRSDIDGDKRPLSPDVLTDIGCDEYYIAPYDADIISVGPSPLTIGSNTATITVKNTGATTWNNDTLYLQVSINGGTPVQQSFLTGTVANQGTATFTFNTSISVPDSHYVNFCGNFYKRFKQADPDKLAEEYCINTCVYNATLVVDQSGKGDFKTINEALNFVMCNTLNSGPITIRVKKGTYNERVVIPAIAGASATNYLRIVGQGMGSKIAYTYTAGEYSTVKLNGAQYVQIDSMNIEANGTTYGWAVHLIGGADNNKISNSRIAVPKSTTSSNSIPIVMSNSTTSYSTSGDNGDNNTFDGNRIIGGYFGVSMFGTNTATRAKGNTFTNNEMMYQYIYGLYAYYQEGMTFSNNYLDSNRNNNYWIMSYYGVKNTYNANKIIGCGYGFYLYYENYYATTETTTISNNMVADFATYGFYASNSYNTKLLHNSINASRSGSSAAVYMASCYYPIMVNNIFANNVGNYTTYLSSTTITNGDIDYNNYYAPSSFYAFYHDGFYTNIGNYTSTYSGINGNSIQQNPGFISNTDLHCTSNNVNNVGDNSRSVGTDFDGETRPNAKDLTVDMGADEFYLSQYNIDVTAVSSPTIVLVGSNNISANFQNRGLKDLSNDTAMVSYTINGGTAITEKMPISSLKVGENMSYTFSQAWSNSITGNFNICVSVDTLFGAEADPDDQVCISRCTGVKDTIVVDANGGGDFLSITDAINKVSCGLLGATVIYVKNGTYNETVSLNNVLGLSSTNTLKIMGEDVDKVIWNAATGGYATLFMSGVQYVDIENITMKNMNTNSSNGTVILMSLGCSNINIDRCKLYASTTYTGSSALIASSSNALLYGYTGQVNAQNIRITNNYLEGSYYGLFLIGRGAGAPDTNIVVSNNQFAYQYQYAMYNYAIGDYEVSNNSYRNQRLASGSAIYQNYCERGNIFNNSIENISNGLVINYENYFGPATNTTTIYNNEVNLVNNNTSTPYGLYLNYGLNTHIYHNTVRTTTSNTLVNGSPLYLVGVLNGTQVKNNNFVAANSGNLAYYSGSGLAAGALDHNNYFSPGAFAVNWNGTNYTSLGAWQAGYSSDNKNSITVNPYFVSGTDLHAAHPSLINGGAMLGISTDIDGDFRHALRPDIGADEIRKDITMTAVLSPSNACRSIGASDSVTVSFMNTGKNAFLEGDTVIVSYTEGAVVASDTLVVPNGYVFNPGMSVDHTFKNYVSSGSAGLHAINAWTSYLRDNTNANDTAKREYFTNANPVAAFSLAEKCADQSTEFSNNTSLALGNIASWQWSFGNSKTGTTKSPTITYGAVGTYNVRLVAISDSGCSDTTFGQAIVHPKPIAAFSTANVCHNTAASFSNSSSLSSGTLSYNWSFGDGATANTSNASRTYANDGNYSVELIANSDKGCKDTATTALTIYPTPVANFSANEACLGNAMPFTNTTTITSGTFSSSWSFGDANTSTTASPSHTYTTAKSYTVQLTTATSNGCSSSKSSTVTVNALPVANFTANNMCYGDKMTPNNTSTGTGLSYAWDFGDGNTSKSQNPDHTYANSGNYTVKLTVTSNKGCENSKSVTVSVANQPQAAFDVNNDCVHNDIEFINKTSVACGSVNKYMWNYGDGNSETITTLSNPKHKYTSAGTYTVRLVIELSNFITDTIEHNVTVYPQPTASYSNTASCVGKAVEFTNKSTAVSGTSIKSYAWAFGDGGTSNLKNPSNTYSSNGNYRVSLISTDSRGCSDTSTTTVEVSPNPTAGFSFTNACAYNDVTFSNSSSVSSGTISSYVWNFGNNTTSSSANPAVNYGTAGYYQVKLLATTAKGCVDSITKTVQAYSVPTASFSASNVCDNEEMAFSNASNGASAYAWNFGDMMGTSTSASPNYTYASNGKYTVQLVATNSNACADTARTEVTVYELPTAKFSVADVCHGVDAAFTNSSSKANSYSWSYGDGKGSNLENPKHGYSSAGTYSVQLIATTTNGCADTTTGSVTVNANPVVSISASNACLYDNVSFSNSTTGAASYAWTFGDGTGTSTATSPSYKYASAGTYTAGITATSSAGCVATGSTSVSAYAVPTASFTSTTVCQGNASDFSNKSSIGSGTLNYSWDFGDSKGSSNNVSPSYTYSAANTYSVKLTATSNNGCVATSTANTTVYGLPTAAFSASNVCLGNSMSFSNSSSSASSYSWNFGDGSSASTTTAPSHTYATSGNYTVTLTAISSNACTSSISRVVTVYSLPTASFTATNECLGEAMSTSNLSSGASSYAWTFGDGGTSTASAPSHSYAKAGNYTLTLTATSSNSCTDQMSQTVSIYALPNVAFSANTACNGSATNFSNSTSNASSYSWNFGDGTSSTLSNPARTYLNDGTYDVILTATSKDGCVEDDTVRVTVNEQPVASFTANTVCSGNETKFSNSSSGTIANYAWNFGNGSGSSSSNPTETYTTGGTYSVSLTVSTAAGCTDQASNNVMVYSTPTAAYTVADACLENGADFADNGSNGNGALIADREFLFGDGNFAFGRSASHKYATAGTYNTKMVITTANGCTDTASIDVAMYEMPIMAIAANDTCANDAIQFVNNSSIGSGTLSYAWNFADGNTSTDNAPMHSFDTAGTFIVMVTATSDMGCTSSESVEVKVYPNPDAFYSVTEVCDGDSVRFQNHSVIEKGSISYEWTLGDGNTSTDENPWHQYGTFGTYEVTLKVISNKACATTYSMPFEVHEQPMAILPLTPICLGDSTLIPQAVRDLVNPNWSYRLTLGDGTVLTELPKGYVYTTAGSYGAGLSIKTPFGCFDSASVSVDVFEVPTLDEWAYTRLENQEISFAATAQGEGLSYEWNFGDGNTASGENANHTFTSAGTFTVLCTVTNANGCTDVVSKEIEVFPTGISETIDAMNITAYPNPYKDWVKLNYNLKADSYVRIEVIDMQGRLISTIVDGNQYSGNYIYELNQADLPVASGNAVVKVIVNQEVIIINLMKLR